MAQAFVITLREGLEMALIVVIVLAYLKRTGRTSLFGLVWGSVGLAAAGSLLAGGVLFGLGKELEGKAEEVFEGIAMFLAVGVLSWMILWMKRQAREIRGQLESQVGQALATGSTMALAAIPFLAVGREGLETALFLFSASKTATPAETLLGGLLGLGGAVVLGGLLYQGGHRINLRSFFNITGVLLILFATGLLARGIHEFQEAGLLPFLVEHVWDMNPILNENGAVGSLLKGLLGYNGNPSLVEVITYPLYLGAALYFFFRSVPAIATRKQAA